MTAPVCKACRPSLPTLCLFLLLLSLVLPNVNSLLVYDRRTLLDLNISAKDLAKYDCNGHKTLPSVLLEIPVYLRRASVPLPWPKCHCRPGKRRGYLVQLKAGLVRSSVPPQTGYGVVPLLFVSRRLLEPVSACLVPALVHEVFQPRCPCSPRPRWHGVNHCNQVSRTADVSDPPAPARCGQRLVITEQICHPKVFVLIPGVGFPFCD